MGVWGVYKMAEIAEIVSDLIISWMDIQYVALV